MTARVAVRGYLSTHLLWSAEHFVDLARSVEAEPGEQPRFEIRHRAYSISAVLAAVAFLEAAINEVFQDAADDHSSYVGDLDSEARKALAQFWGESQGNASLFSKYQYALVLARRPTLERGTQPLQDANLLVKLRNALVHFVPETVVSGEVQRLESQLARLFPPSALAEDSGNPFFPDKCLGAGCGAWAVTSARALADETFKRLGMTPDYQRVRWDPSGKPINEISH